MSELTSDVITRRHAVASIINFANASIGATWQLVNVTEEPRETVVEYDLTFPIRDIRGSETKRVRIAITTGDENSEPASCERF